jgi:hypothetical protein
MLTFVFSIYNKEIKLLIFSNFDGILILAIYTSKMLKKNVK